MLYVVCFSLPHHLFYQQKVSWLICFWAKKWPRVLQILHFLQLFPTPNPLFNGKGPLLSVTTTIPQLGLNNPLPTSIHPSSNSVAMVCQCFYRPPQVNCYMLFVRCHLLYSLLKRLNVCKFATCLVS